MKKLLITFLSFALFGILSQTAYASETIKEKAEAKYDDAKRTVKQVKHRTEETFCNKGDAACLAKKGQNRVEEGKDYVKDKAKQGSNIVDEEEDKTNKKK